ncbi:MAG: TetR/AcrR family transcriptional regulator [Rhodoluna sp.]
MAPRIKSIPQPKQARAQDTIDLVISEANAAIEVGGESSVRIQEISAKTGVSVGSIYHHFGDRDGLIRATYVHNFATSIKHDIARAKRFMDEMHSTQEMAEHYDEMLQFLVDHFKHVPADKQANIIGSTAGRPLLRAALAEVQHELTQQLTEVMQLLRDRGMLKPHLSPRAAAVMVLGMLHGRIIAEIDTTPVSDHEWNQAMISAFGGLFLINDQMNV